MVLGTVKHLFSTLKLAALILVLVSWGTAWPQDIQTLARAIDNHYNHLHTLRADFTETYTVSGTDRTELGTLWLKKPGKMRWEYRSPREKLFVSDGQEAWFYVTGDRQARRMPMSDLNDLRSPLGLLLGKTRLQKELKDLRFAADIPAEAAEDRVLEGNPATMAGQIEHVVLEVTPDDQISRIILDGSDGSITKYKFSSQTEGIAVPDQDFRFIPPPGVEVVEGDLAP